MLELLQGVARLRRILNRELLRWFDFLSLRHDRVHAAAPVTRVVIIVADRLHVDGGDLKVERAALLQPRLLLLRRSRLLTVHCFILDAALGLGPVVFVLVAGLG